MATWLINQSLNRLLKLQMNINFLERFKNKATTIGKSGLIVNSPPLLLHKNPFQQKMLQTPQEASQKLVAKSQVLPQEKARLREHIKNSSSLFKKSKSNLQNRDEQLKVKSQIGRGKQAIIKRNSDFRLPPINQQKPAKGERVYPASELDKRSNYKKRFREVPVEVQNIIRMKDKHHLDKQKYHKVPAKLSDYSESISVIEYNSLKNKLQANTQFVRKSRDQRSALTDQIERKKEKGIKIRREQAQQLQERTEQVIKKRPLKQQKARDKESQQAREKPSDVVSSDLQKHKVQRVVKIQKKKIRHQDPKEINKSQVVASAVVQQYGKYFEGWSGAGGSDEVYKHLQFLQKVEASIKN